jgi:hypothetical protein
MRNPAAATDIALIFCLILANNKQIFVALNL